MEPIVIFTADAFDEILTLGEDGDTSLAVTLIDDFVISQGVILGKLRLSYADQKVKDFERDVHSLKSSSRLLGLNQVGSICLAMEELARSGSFPPLSQLTQLSQALEVGLKELSRFRATLV